MPDTGFGEFGPFDPGEPIDMSGGGIDPSYAYALSGSHFPGEYQNALEYLAAMSRGTNTGNPFASVHGLDRLPGRLGDFFSWVQRNNQQGGAGQQPDYPGGWPYHFFSGPGGAYGPDDPATRGLADVGRPVGEAWDMPEHRPDGNVPAGAGKPGRGGGGGGGGGFHYTPYAGINYKPEFVDWQPIQPGTPGPYEPTRMVPGRGGTTRTQPKPPGRGGKPAAVAGGGKGPGGGGAGGGQQQQAGDRGLSAIPGPGQGGMPTDPMEYWQEVMRRLGLGGDSGSGAAATSGPHGQPQHQSLGEAARSQIHGGIDSNYLDYMTPGWTRDRTTGIMNTSGMPSSTIPQPMSGESFDTYLTRLHDSGVDQATIQSLLGPNGYRQDPHTGAWEFGWGTGPVTRDPATGNYVFANQEQSAAPSIFGTGAETPFWPSGNYGDSPGARGTGMQSGAQSPAIAHAGGTGMSPQQSASFNDFISGAPGSGNYYI